MISFENVAKSYDAKSRPALESVTLDVARGEFVFLVGASGSGKSTLLQLVLREQRPTKGKVLVAGKDIAKLPSWKVPHLRRQMGAVFQDFRLLPNKTVHENVAFALQVIGKSRSHINETVPEVLEMVGLSDKSRRMPHELSGGEQQRVAIARAIANRPVLLLADEPTGNMDPTTSLGIMRVLDRIQRGGTTVVMATHDDVFVNTMRKRVIELSEGRVIRDEDFGEYTTTHIPVVQLTPPEEQIVEEIAEEEALADARAAEGDPGWVPADPAGETDETDADETVADDAAPDSDNDPVAEPAGAAETNEQTTATEPEPTKPTISAAKPATSVAAAAADVDTAGRAASPQTADKPSELADLAALADEQQPQFRQSDTGNLARHLADRLRKAEEGDEAAPVTEDEQPEAPATPTRAGRHASRPAADSDEAASAASDAEQAEQPKEERLRSRRAERANRAQRSGLFRRR